MARRGIALLLLCANASAGAHLLLERHAVSQFGAVVDAPKPCALGEHQAAGGASFDHSHAQEQQEECSAVALARSLGSVEVGAQVPTAVVAAAVYVAVAATPEVAPLDILSVAPKCSPPA